MARVLRVNYREVTEHAQKIMKDLGITWQVSTAQSITDSYWFWNCENVPGILPKGIDILEKDPMKYIGYGLSKEEAEKIRDYQTNPRS